MLQRELELLWHEQFLGPILPELHSIAVGYVGHDNVVHGAWIFDHACVHQHLNEHQYWPFAHVGMATNPDP